METKDPVDPADLLEHRDNLVFLDHLDTKDKEENVDLVKRERGAKQDTVVAYVLALSVVITGLNVIQQNLVILVMHQIFQEWSTHDGVPVFAQIPQRLSIQEQLPVVRQEIICACHFIKKVMKVKVRKVASKSRLLCH